MAMVDTLVPGVSTLTRFARYYTLYWALADFAEEHGLEAPECQSLLRRAEVALALVSRDSCFDRVNSLVDRGESARLAEVGTVSYSPRPWGFWSQYGGPSAALGTVEVKGGALRRGRHACPPALRAMFRPLLELVRRRPFHLDDAPAFAGLALDRLDAADMVPVRELFTATRNGRHDAHEWTGNDHTRRATLRILIRAVQLRPSTVNWADALRECVAYGNTLDTDPVLSKEERAQAWRGVLLRHHSVGAWRRLWAELVEQVRADGGSVTRDDLHAWISSEVPEMTVRDFVMNCPAIVDPAGHPLPAEEQIHAALDTVEGDLAVLLVGGLRLDQLTGKSLAAFLGRKPGGRGQFLDPSWVAFQQREHRNRSMGEFARALVDDMLAQSRRVALRKLTVDTEGRMTLFTRLHERNGRYFADQPEGAGNVGLRLEQLGFMAVQLGLFELDGTSTTESAAELLALPA
jgi:hypothetical protein